MTIDSSYVDNLRKNHISVKKAQEAEILTLFSEEPADCYEWTEQDIYEQIRKTIR